MPNKPIVRKPKDLIPSIRKIDKLSAVLQKLPPEAFMKAIDIVTDVIRANKIMDARQQEFEHSLVTIREIHMDKKERLHLLMGILREVNLDEASQRRLVEAICKIAED